MPTLARRRASVAGLNRYDALTGVEPEAVCLYGCAFDAVHIRTTLARIPSAASPLPSRR